MNVMNEAWVLLKENVATTHTEYGSHMPEIKPHPAAVSYAQRAGYQPDGKVYPNVPGAKPSTATTQVPKVHYRGVRYNLCRDLNHHKRGVQLICNHLD